MEIEWISILAVIVATSIAVSIDLRTRRIPNWLTVSTFVLGLFYHIFTGGLDGFLLSLGGFATGFGTLLVLWLMGSGGGGDVKLMGAVGAWLGAFPTLLIFIASAVFAVFCTIAVLVHAHYGPQQLVADGGVQNSNQASVMKQTIPYALPVNLAVWSLFVFTLIY